MSKLRIAQVEIYIYYELINQSINQSINQFCNYMPEIILGCYEWGRYLLKICFEIKLEGG